MYFNGGVKGKCVKPFLGEFPITFLLAQYERTVHKKAKTFHTFDCESQQIDHWKIRSFQKRGSKFFDTSFQVSFNFRVRSENETSKKFTMKKLLAPPCRRYITHQEAVKQLCLQKHSDKFLKMGMGINSDLWAWAWHRSLTAMLWHNCTWPHSPALQISL